MHALSAYEFARHYRFKQATHPQTEQAHHNHINKPELYHAKLTEQGAKKVEAAGRSPSLIAGEDYQIRDAAGEEWLCLGQGEHVNPAYRHDWMIVPRKRPYVPVPYGAQGSKSEEEQAMKLLLLFFPWVNDINDATPAVPFVGNLWVEGGNSWREALRDRTFTHGFPTAEVKRFVLNFCIVHFLARDLQLQDGLYPNSDDEGIADDLDLALDEEDLVLATLTHVRGGGSARGSREDEPIAEEEEDGGEAAAQNRCSTLFELTTQMFQLSSSIWLASDRLQQADAKAQARHQNMLRAGQVRDHALARKAAAAAKKEEDAHEDRVVGLLAQAGTEDGPWTKERPRVTKAALEAWLASEEVRKGTNHMQLEFLKLVVDRIMVELGLISDAQSLRQTSDPLVWLLHGPPGTGKSHVLGFVRELFDMMGYTYGLDYEVAAFQAVNAADLKGKTMHKAFGWKAKGGPPDEGAKREAHKRMAHWRWLILDEISLVDAKLLGQAEKELREVVPVSNPWKTKNDQVRPFAGINVIFTGDFHQLPPPAGIYLAQVPRAIRDPTGERAPENALGDHGKQIFWTGAVQGITELVDRERCKDEWWTEVSDEIRHGCLSDKNHKYLHGERVEGCTLSEAERRSRKRVIDGPDDPRLQEAKFKEAMVVVANNDARYQVNKDRAKNYSQASGAPLYWSVARDEATSAALQADPCDKDAKIRWGERGRTFSHAT